MVAYRKREVSSGIVFLDSLLLNKYKDSNVIQIEEANTIHIQKKSGPFRGTAQLRRRCEARGVDILAKDS